MADCNEHWLVSFDTDRIKNYIFATNSLKEIRGASAILVQQDKAREHLLEKDAAGSKLDGEVIYAAGGGGALLIKSLAEPKELVQRIEREFRHATQTATISAEVISRQERPDSKWFGRHMAAASEKLQQKKSRKGELSSLPVEPYMRLCASCGYQPAETRLANDPTGELLCASCAQKRKMGKTIRDDHNEEGFVGRYKEFVRKSTAAPAWLHADPPDDLNELGDLDGSGYVGFVYIDGNQMGKLLRLMEEKKNYSEYSGQLDSLVRNIVFGVLEGRTKPIRGVLPFEIVLIGGDDVMLFTTASDALCVTLAILERFEKESPELLKSGGLLQNEQRAKLRKEFGDEIDHEPFLIHEKLTMAAGVVLCHSNFPIPALVEIAEALLKKAKKKCAKAMVTDKGSPEKKSKYGESAIDFQVVSGSAMNLDMARSAVPHNRPYTRSEMQKLLHYTARFHNPPKFPRSQLQMIYDACHVSCQRRSPVQGTMAALTALARLRDSRHRKLLREFFKEFAPPNGFAHLWPWTFINKQKRDGQGMEKRNQELKTVFVDLVDVYDFVKGELS